MHTDSDEQHNKNPPKAASNTKQEPSTSDNMPAESQPTVQRNYILSLPVENDSGSTTISEADKDEENTASQRPPLSPTKQTIRTAPIATELQHDFVVDSNHNSNHHSSLLRHQNIHQNSSTLPPNIEMSAPPKRGQKRRNESDLNALPLPIARPSPAKRRRMDIMHPYPFGYSTPVHDTLFALNILIESGDDNTIMDIGSTFSIRISKMINILKLKGVHCINYDLLKQYVLELQRHRQLTERAGNILMSEPRPMPCDRDLNWKSADFKFMSFRSFVSEIIEQHSNVFHVRAFCIAFFSARMQNGKRRSVADPVQIDKVQRMLR